MNETKTSPSASLDDVIRSTLSGGSIVELPEEEQREKVKQFKDFLANHAPQVEHDFEAFECGDWRCFWKVAHYDKALTAGSDDPSKPPKTTRLLTLIMVEED